MKITHAFGNLISRDASVRVANYKGKDCLQLVVDLEHRTAAEGGCDDCTFVEYPFLDFRDGIIEIDIAGKPSENAGETARGFVGIFFRVSGDEYEGFYLRPTNASSPERRDHTVQFISMPDRPWDVLRENYPGKYECYASVEVGEWTNIRIMLDGTTAALSINHSAVPIMVVDSLRPGGHGSIGLFAEPETDAYFRELNLYTLL